MPDDKDITRPIEPIEPEDESIAPEDTVVDAPAAEAEPAEPVEPTEPVEPADTNVTRTVEAPVEEPVYADAPVYGALEEPAVVATPADVSPARNWWLLPLAIVVVIVILGLIGVAVDNNDNGSSKNTNASASTTTLASGPTTTLKFTTQTTVPAGAVTTVAPAATAAASPATTAAGAVNNRPLTIEARWDPGAPAVGEQVTFNVSVSDPDARPIKEGACGTGNGVSFGDDGGVPASCSSGCSTGGSANASPSPGSATFTYTHTYAAAGTYVVTLVYTSGDRCSDAYSSTNKLTFNITVS